MRLSRQDVLRVLEGWLWFGWCLWMCRERIGSDQSSHGMVCGLYLDLWFPHCISVNLFISCSTRIKSTGWWLANFHVVGTVQSTDPVLSLYRMLSLWTMVFTTPSTWWRHDQVQAMARLSRWSTVHGTGLPWCPLHHYRGYLRRVELSRSLLVPRSMGLGWCLVDLLCL
jgi:hypothetical protein